ncbi:phage tail protein [Pseudomonas sp. PA15(2017)]|uniref:phage tail assembly protein n=1 Tax=Pseudomonas sp. PA15(2017) TaxID=1932111 RepID=UPI00095C0138|nr:phage tail assembly protein [Pseudomonas sp. PA15(2017)]OLU22484.1 phage tail protein [Pseudomonas sp. PA15(2017)]
MATPETVTQETNPNEAQVELDTPISRGETTISHLTLRKPSAGELRGVSLAELLQLDVTAVRKVLPRISNPTLTDQEIGRMDPADLLDVAAKVAGFLLKKAQREEISASLNA